MNTLLTAYLNLESRMLAFDEQEAEQEADRLRDEMDHMWHQLSPDDRQWLNSRCGTR